MGFTAGGKMMKKNVGWKGGLLSFALYMWNKESNESVHLSHDFIFRLRLEQLTERTENDRGKNYTKAINGNKEEEAKVWFLVT